MLKIFTVRNNKEKDKIMDYLNSVAKDCYDTEKERVLSLLENDLQKVIYLDWWNSGHLWKGEERAERYKHVNDHDWEMARGYIMETISRGMG
ncbi:MAG TPA: hypothetical protein VEF53_18675 [Patescibacteria group bacterium]|nr:hypothetical protein [Patescibacteria group bacterium]